MIIRKTALFIASLLAIFALQAQSPVEAISVEEVSRIQKTLSADDMEGRRTFTKGIEKAAAFIAHEFGAAGLQKPKGQSGFLQEFSMYLSKLAGAKVVLDGESVSQADIICQSVSENLNFDETSGYEVATIGAKDNFMNMVRPLRSKTSNLVVFVDTTHRQIFNRLKSFAGARFPSNTHQVYILTANVTPKAFKANITMQVQEQKLANVVGIIPGKSKPDEYVIFSGHYDHLGYGKPNEKGDSLYNGANDDASGTTAVIMLAKHFQAQANNERTLVFAAFTAEEVGGFGSQYFSKQYDPAKVMAMFNIEMIGTDSKWGNNSAYITGYEKTDMGKILEKNLEGTAFKFYPDPYPQQQLFYRSDNATLARLGVPAHTLSTSKMDSEPHYHKASDEFETLDMHNMAEVIKAIALSSRSIVAGKDTPSRVDATQLSR